MAKGVLDLHGYKLDEVFDAVDAHITREVKNKRKETKIMPGKGSGKVKTEVLRYLKLGGYPWRHEKLKNGKDNAGVLVIFLD